ncbi:roadblock/LC7 domain-containing protein [candidate division WOR-3 bacterium]|nr:roadblock/LC7 domain-containing protein [candidate division WOR-3 bacterium]
MSFQIFENDFWAINETITKLLKMTNAIAVLLIDKAGQLITSTGNISQIDTTSFASLSAADFAATSQLAKLVGESNFNTLFHQGENQNLYIQLIANKVILVVIFDSRTSLGLVRVRIKHATDELNAIILDIMEKIDSNKANNVIGLDTDFKEQAENELDELFK